MTAPLRSKVLLLGLTWAAVSAAGPLEDLKPGEWYEVPNSQLKALDPCPTHDCDYSATSGQRSVISAWCGAGFDVTRDRLIVWGGGHADYGGNELYAFDLNTLAWSRLTNPSSPPAKDVPYSSDGQPTSRHTYDSLQYVPALDAFCTFGGSALYISGQNVTYNTDCFYFATNQWVRRADMPGVAGGLIAAYSAVDSATGHVWVHGTGTYSAAVEYDPMTNAWAAHGGRLPENAFTYWYTTAAIDPVHRLFITVGGNFAAKWNMALGEISGEPLVTTGDQSVVKAIAAPGFVYDSANDVFVGWLGGADVFTLDTTTWEWTRRVPAATNTVTPTAACVAGTYGRFAYSPQKNLFVVVNSNQENVFVYRLSNQTGQPFDAGTVVGPPDAGVHPPVLDAGAEVTNDAGAELGAAQGRCGCSMGFEPASCFATLIAALALRARMQLRRGEAARRPGALG